jgi:hypothetical protein
MASFEQVIPSGSPVEAVVLSRNPDRPEDLGIRVNWLFTGVLLGAASWLLILAVVFAALGQWITAAGLFAGLCLCLLGMRGAERRRRAARQDSGHGRHRAVAGPERPDMSIVS